MTLNILYHTVASFGLNIYEVLHCCQYIPWAPAVKKNCVKKIRLILLKTLEIGRKKTAQTGQKYNK